MSDNFTERAIKKNIKNQRQSRAITLQGAIETN